MYKGAIPDDQNSYGYFPSGLNHSRNLSTEGIEGASPQKFKHMSKKLFVDRKEILSVFGGKPGRYHGYSKDKPVGGTYKVTDSQIWEDKAKLKDSLVAGARVQNNRGFQAKRQPAGLLNERNYSYIANSPTKPLDYSKLSSDIKTKLIQQRVMKDLQKYKRESRLPYLKESASNPLVDPMKSSNQFRLHKSRA